MEFCWSTLQVKNMEESLSFYQGILSLPLNRRFPAGPNMEIAFLGDGDTKIELVCSKDKENINIGQDISWGFAVNSLDETMKHLQENGVTSFNGPFQPNPHVKFIYVIDPNGMKIQLVENM
ncbi:MAG TPA: VOC family protein [Clostridia bacterium]|nr:VOC family protein [Clostridia bacterium]